MFSKGQKINDRYEIIKSIGEGGMANVYLAYDTILERNVAVKVLRGDLADDDKFVRRFQREALSASSLSHPNIVEMYDVGEDNGNFYIVMEYIDGKTLKQLIKRRGHLTVTEAIDIMLQLTDGLIAAHDSYIIHRDIKPQNIMILEDGMVKITDFGIAMAINAADLTQTNSVMGSVHYLPPEQAAGKGSTIKSDIYSLGILFYEMLAGTMPFRGETAVEIALKHIKDPMPSIRKINSKVPQSVENIILKATAKNPKNRYNNARELHDDLTTALSPDRENEKRFIFKYAEDDLDETKVLDTLKDELKIKDNKLIEEKPEVKDITLEEFDDKKKNKITKILIIVCSILVIGLLLIVVIIPTIFKTPDVKVPDVSGLTVREATKELEKFGLTVATKVKDDYTDEIEKGKVSKTEPEARQTVKKGAKIVIYKSLGSDKITIEDYTGIDYNKVQASLEVKGLSVIIEYKTVDDKGKYKGKENLVIGQSPEKGTNLLNGDSITLYLPKVIKEYPDFINEQYKVSEVQEFCKEYDLQLEIEEVIDDTKEEGTIIYQSRPAGSEIAERVTLKIKVTKKTPANGGEDGKIDGMVPYNNGEE
ncbi:MAG: Stk1 family PASTA domain-containing Ser/Thr kinase [Bacilli bacterium]|nr:Stk1 family PASTA domain-containing Ser/Thr kinase [Bacilli bacterium]MBP3635315.1 Stk1 family PASTA domain-containing Ser/Thr kinase [Bacilli bacterium]